MRLRRHIVFVVFSAALLSGCSLFSSSPKSRPSIASVKTVRLATARKYIGRLLWPVPHSALSSNFGQRWSEFHEGIDIRAPEGTPIYAAHSGQVVYSNDGLRGYGNLIVLKGDGILTVYGHNRKNRVSRGEFVQAGDQIADVGQSGKATGPHLHFETRVKDPTGKNVAVDPLVFFSRKS